MDNFINIISGLIEEQKKFDKVYKEHLKQDKLADQKKVKLNVESFYKNKPLLIEDVLKMGENMDKEYEKVYCGYNNDQLEDIRENDIKLLFDDEEVEHNFFSSEKDIKEENKKLARDNVKDQYYKIVKILADYGFTIYHVKIDLTQFHNRRVSCLCSDCEPFVFYCRKNNWRFTVEFCDDCDCDPGILSAQDLFNIKTEKKFEGYCDLYGNNTNIEKARSFLKLLEYENIEQYLKMELDHLHKLIPLLKERGYVISDIKNKLDKVEQYVNGHLKFTISYPNKDKKYKVFFISKSEAKFFEWNKKFEDCEGSSDLHNAAFFEIIKFIPYSSTSDIDNFCNNIDTNIKEFENEYGYLENGVYYNDKYIEEHSKVEWNHNFDLLKNIHINSTTFVESNGSSTYFKCDYKNYYIKVRINIIYDLNEDKDNCYLNVQSLHKDINSEIVKVNGYNNFGKFSELFDECNKIIDIFN